MKHKGVICGILAAVCYGTNPFGALPLYEEGVNTSSVLFYRFTMAVVILGVMLLVQRKSFSINNKELKVLLLLGVLFSASCITYYESFQVIGAGCWHRSHSFGSTDCGAGQEFPHAHHQAHPLGYCKKDLALEVMMGSG